MVIENCYFDNDAIPREIHDRLVREAKREALRDFAEWSNHQAPSDWYGRTAADMADAYLASEHEQEESPQTAAQLHDWHKRRKPTGNQP
jgi:hypothetical protein